MSLRFSLLKYGHAAGRPFAGDAAIGSLVRASSPGSVTEYGEDAGRGRSPEKLVTTILRFEADHRRRCFGL
jgi:hypothetical protein